MLAYFVIIDYFQKSLAFISKFSFGPVCFLTYASVWKYNCVSN